MSLLVTLWLQILDLLTKNGGHVFHMEADSLVIPPVAKNDAKAQPGCESTFAHLIDTLGVNVNSMLFFNSRNNLNRLQWSASVASVETLGRQSQSVRQCGLATASTSLSAL